MKNMPLAKVVENEDGFVLVAAMLILIILVVIGISATNTTNIEYQIAVNDRVAKEDFYNQETCLANGKFQFRTWLTTAYLNTAENAAFFPGAGTDANGNGINDLSECVDPNGIVTGSYKIRNVEASGTAIAGWEDIASFPTVAAHPANNFPTLAHIDKPDPGSGFDPKNFEIRRFVITSYSPDNDKKVVLQEGVYKVFNKF
jgi:Tfp pilus assembly protein PilX